MLYLFPVDCTFSYIELDRTNLTQLQDFICAALALSTLSPCGLARRDFTGLVQRNNPPPQTWSVQAKSIKKNASLNKLPALYLQNEHSEPPTGDYQYVMNIDKTETNQVKQGLLW